jgi:hypothetical protein
LYRFRRSGVSFSKLAGCEADAGPAGQQGPEGPSTIVAFGTISNSGAVLTAGPSTVTETAAAVSTRRYEVTAIETDSVPAVEPLMLATAFSGGGFSREAVTDVDCYGGVSVGATCAFNETKFEVFISDPAGTLVDEQFSFVLLRPQP